MTAPEPTVQPDDGPATERSVDLSGGDLTHDRHRVTVLRRLAPDHPVAVKYGEDLAEYAIGTMMDLHKAHELHPTVQRKTKLPPLPTPPPSWTTAEFRSLVALAVLRSVKPFLESAVRQGAWNPDGGASLKVFFFGKCCYAYYDDYKRACREETLAVRRLLHRAEPTIEREDGGVVLRAPSPGPERIVINRDWFRRLLAEAPDERMAIIAFLQSEGMTTAEIAGYLAMTPGEVQNELRRLRRALARRRTI